MQRILNKREKLIMLLTAGVIIFSITYGFTIEPLLNKYSTLNEQISVTKRKTEKYLSLLAQKESIQKRYRSFYSSLTDKAEPNGNLIDILAQIEVMAKSSGVNILDIRPRPQNARDAYKETVIELRTEASMRDYIKFIYNVENSLNLLRIKEFQLKSKPKSQLLEGALVISKLSLD